MENMKSVKCFRKDMKTYKKNTVSLWRENHSVE